jgi:hypothetical protein
MSHPAAPPATPAEAIARVLDSLRELRLHYQAAGDALAVQVVERCMARASRCTSSRTDPGRRGDDPADTGFGGL